MEAFDRIKSAGRKQILSQRGSSFKPYRGLFFRAVAVFDLVLRASRLSSEL